MQNNYYLLQKNITKKVIGFVSLDEHLDTATSVGQIIFTMLCAIAQLDRDIIVENTKAGLEAVRARGRNGGRPKTDPKKIKKYKNM